MKMEYEGIEISFEKNPYEKPLLRIKYKGDVVDVIVNEKDFLEVGVDEGIPVVVFCGDGENFNVKTWRD